MMPMVYSPDQAMFGESVVEMSLWRTTVVGSALQLLLVSHV